MQNEVRVILSVIIIMALLLGSGLPFGEQPASASDEEEINLPPLELPEKGNPKLDSRLNQLVSAETTERAAGFAWESNIEMVDGNVRVIVECLPGQVEAATRAAGDLGVVETSYGDLLQVSVPVSQLTALADMSGISLVRTPYYPSREVVSQGVELINADDWNTTSFTGAGVKIAVLDLGFTSYDTLLGNELPATVTTKSFLHPSDIGGNGEVHGTACAEIVYDIAPDAHLYLVNYSTDVEMATAVAYCISEGVDVISSSVGWPVYGSGDGTGPICDMVDVAESAGIVWAQSVGNHAERHWQGSFVDSFDGDGIHEFSQSPFDETNEIDVNDGDLIRVSLRWDDTWGAAVNDYDLLLLDSSLSIVALSANPQSLGYPFPNETLVYTAEYTGDYHIAIATLGSPAVVDFHLMSWRHDLQYQVAAGSFVIPADSPNAISVGAVPWNDPTTLEPFSSHGPTDAPASIIKPDLVAPDFVNNTTYNPFGGTSASAPHVAGAAALVKQRYPSYNPAQIKAYLEANAIEIGGDGKDNLYGSGLLNLGSAGGSISGNVTDLDTGDPIEGATVGAWDFNQLGAVPWAPYAEATTDASGNYTITGLPVGDYVVSAIADGHERLLYQDVHPPSEADPVPVYEGVDTQDINFSLGPGGTISGTATSQNPGILLANVSVVASSPNMPGGVSLALTDENGDYTLEGLPYGNYVIASPAGFYVGSGDNSYIIERWQEKSPSDIADDVTVDFGENPVDIDFTLEVGGTISGHVDDGTDPIAGAIINVFDYDSIFGSWVFWGVGVTDEDGNYETTGLPAGDYGVRVTADGYASEWHNGTYYREQAARVTVAAPGNTPNIDFHLEPGGSISGHVDDGSSPIANMHVNIHDYNNHQWVAGVNTDASGEYTLSGLPDGSYRVGTCAHCVGLSYIDEYYNNTYFWPDADAVTIEFHADIAGIDFSLGLGATISGHVYATDGGAPIENANVEIIDYASLPGQWLHYGGMRTDANGYYKSSGLPDGDYGVRALTPGYANEWYNGEYYRDDADQVGVSLSNDAEGIDFYLEEGGSISGTVYESDGETPIPFLHVCASDSDTNQWAVGTNTDAFGNYTIYGLLEGSYVVRADPCGDGLPYVAEYYNDVYTSWENADPVPVTPPGNTGGIDFLLESTEARATVAEAIADGVAWLAGQQNPDGSWGTYYQVAKTGLAVLKLITHAGDLGMHPLDPDYPYSNEIQDGFDFLFDHANISDVTMQGSNNPDTNEDGWGVYFRSPSFPPGYTHFYDIYETSIVLMAVSANSTLAGITVDVSGSPVDGWTYGTVAQDAVDYLAWAQTDSGFGRGGWNYMPMNNEGDRSDQSNSGWVTLGLAYAENFGREIPDFVRTELDIWIDYIQDDVDGDDNDGGSLYTDSAPPDWVWLTNMLRTGNLLQQMAFVGDTESATRVEDAWDYLVRHWDKNNDPGWRGCPACYHSTYTVMKGLEALGIETVDSTDWYQDITDVIMSQQSADGWWPCSRYDDGELILSTEWALLTLQKAVPPTEMKPDLVILDKYEEWEVPGVSYKVHFTIKNRGNASTEIGPGVIVVIDDVIQEGVIIFPPLGPGESFSDIIWEITISGYTDNVTVCADPYNDIDELNEDNNCQSNTWPPPPDLIISDKWEEWVGESENYTVHFTVENIGEGIAPYGHDVRLILPPSNIPLEFKEVPIDLGPGASWTSSFDTEIELTDGFDIVHVLCDANGEVDELNELNNGSINSIAWPEAPDLITWGHYEEWVDEGVYKVHFGVRNIGNATASAEKVSLTVDGTLREKMAVPALAQGELHTGNFTTLVSLTSNVDSVLVCADVDEEVAESREDNNCLEHTYAWSPKPDLVIGKAENWIVSGNNYIVTCFLSNIGNADAPAGHDVSLAVDGVLIDTVEAPLIPAGQTWLYEFPAIDLSGGTDQITVCADTNGELVESREDNNCQTNYWPGLPPDLRISAKWEEWVGESENYTVHFTVENIGEGTAPAGHTVNVVLPPATPLYEEVVGVELAPGEIYTGNFSMQEITLTDGFDIVKVNADVYGVVDEANEWNNGRNNTFARPAAPDLIITRKHEEWVDEGVYQVHFTVRNMGNAAASAGTASLTVDGTWVESVPVPALDPCEDYSDYFITPVSLTNGVDSVVVCADAGEEITESREDNNCRQNTVAWPSKPDLVMGKEENWIVPGYSYTVTFFLFNNGNADAPGGHDVYLTVDGVLIETAEIPPIPAGKMWVNNFSTPIDLSDSSDEIVVVADCNHEVSESREDNNFARNFWPAAPPDLVISEKHEDWVVPGVLYRVYFSVRNIGGMTALAGHEVHLDIDHGRLTEDKEVLIDLGPGDSWTSSFDTVIDLTDDSDNVVVFADASGEVAESDEWNNMRFNNIAWPEAPDLLIDEKHEERVDEGVYKVYFTVRNMGNATASASSASLTVDGTWVESVPVPALAQDEVYSGNFTTEIALTGSWDSVVVCADADEEVAELYEENNCHENTHALPPAPDLVIMNKSEEEVSEGVYKVTCFVRNIGNIPAGPPGYEVALRVDGAVVETVVINDVIPPSTNMPGGMLPCRFTTEITLSGGSDFISVCADDSNNVTESREDNNCQANFWPPAEVVVSIDAPDIMPEGAEFTAYVDITEVVDLNAAQYDIWFDPTVLWLQGITDGEIDSTVVPVPSGEIAPQEIDPGHWRIVQSMGLGVVSGSGYLAELHFQVIGSFSDSSVIDITDGVLSGLYNEISATWAGDTIIISTIAGDANGDGAINVLDMTKVARIALGLDPATTGADCNLDGTVNVLDMTCIARKILGID